MDKVAAHRRCENCHLPENDDGPDDPSYHRGLWAPAPFFKKSDLGVEGLGSSRLCLSCHDGSLGGETGSHLGMDGVKEERIDLFRSHPVAVEYRVDHHPGGRRLNPPAAISPLKLYNRTVECVTCHDIHSHNPARLRISKRELCFRCHAI